MKSKSKPKKSEKNKELEKRKEIFEKVLNEHPKFKNLEKKVEELKELMQISF